jgi:hypothetical protein
MRYTLKVHAHEVYALGTRPWYTPKVHVQGNRYAYKTPAHKAPAHKAPAYKTPAHKTPAHETHAYEIHAHDVVVHGIYAREVHAYCEGLPGVYSTIWCLCYKTNKLKKRKEEGGPEKGATSGLGSCGVASGVA